MEISPEFSLEGLMLRLKIQYFVHLMPKADSLEKTLMLGKIKGRRRRGRQWLRWLNGITDLMGMSLSKFWEKVKHSETWCAAVHGLQRVGQGNATEQKQTYITMCKMDRACHSVSFIYLEYNCFTMLC